MSQLAVTGNGGGTGVFTLTSPNSNTNRTITLPDATTTVVGTDTTQTLTNKTIQGGTITSGTAVASTSGTSIDFTGIPSWVKRITVASNNVLKTGTTNLAVQLGTSSGVQTTGYVSVSSYSGNSNIAGYTSATTGFATAGDANTTQGLLGMFTIVNISGNLWIANLCGSVGASGVYAITGGGSVTLSGALTRVRITTLSGTDTFTAGSINILYE